MHPEVVLQLAVHGYIGRVLATLVKIGIGMTRIIICNKVGVLLSVKQVGILLIVIPTMTLPTLVFFNMLNMIVQKT